MMNNGLDMDFHFGYTKYIYLNKQARKSSMEVISWRLGDHSTLLNKIWNNDIDLNICLPRT